MERGQSPLLVSLLGSDDSNSVTTSFRVWWGPKLKGLVGPMVGQPARYYGTARAVFGWGLERLAFDYIRDERKSCDNLAKVLVNASKQTN